MNDTISAHPLDSHNWVPRPTGKGSVALGTAQYEQVCSMCGLTWAQWRMQECDCGHPRAGHIPNDGGHCDAAGCPCMEMRHAS